MSVIARHLNAGQILSEFKNHESTSLGLKKTKGPITKKAIRVKVGCGNGGLTCVGVLFEQDYSGAFRIEVSVGDLLTHTVHNRLTMSLYDNRERDADLLSGLYRPDQQIGQLSLKARMKMELWLFDHKCQLLTISSVSQRRASLHEPELNEDRQNLTKAESNIREIMLCPAFMDAEGEVAPCQGGSDFPAELIECPFPKITPLRVRQAPEKSGEISTFGIDLIDADVLLSIVALRCGANRFYVTHAGGKGHELLIQFSQKVTQSIGYDQIPDLPALRS